MTATAGFYPPTLAPLFSLGSSIENEDAIVAIRASNGALRGRNFQTTSKAKFVLRHSMLSAAMLADVKSGYSLNRNRTFQLTFDGATYTCMWVAPLRWQPKGSGWYDAELRCEEV